jgi:hypothetical protein
MEVICLQEPAFYTLIDKVVDYIKSQNEVKEEKWISGEKAMLMLDITSKTTLQRFRDEGRIRFSQFGKKNIVYDRDSINDYLEKNAKEKF